NNPVNSQPADQIRRLMDGIDVLREHRNRLVPSFVALAGSCKAGITFVILLHVKTAISLSDDVFDTAERLSKRLGISRSRLYAKAVEAFVKAHRSEGVREALDAVYGSESSNIDPALARMQRRSVAGSRKW
ncbi:MAG: hypothetical protein AAB368_16660, partial [bacterium]